MKSATMFAVTIAGIALVAAVGWPMAARAAQASDKSATAQSTPKGWNYEIVNGKRVPKADRKVNADGSTREEVRVGNCVTIKEKTADGFKESRSCN